MELQEASVNRHPALKPSDDELDAIERVLGYTFRDRDLMRRAFWCAVAVIKGWVIASVLLTAWVKTPGFRDIW